MIAEEVAAMVNILPYLKSRYCFFWNDFYYRVSQQRAGTAEKNKGKEATTQRSKVEVYFDWIHKPLEGKAGVKGSNCYARSNQGRINSKEFLKAGLKYEVPV